MHKPSIKEPTREDQRPGVGAEICRSDDAGRAQPQRAEVAADDADRPRSRRQSRWRFSSRPATSWPSSTSTSSAARKTAAADAARAAENRNAAARASDRFHDRRVRRHADRAPRAGRGRASRSEAQRREIAATIPRWPARCNGPSGSWPRATIYDEAREFSRLVSTAQNGRRAAASWS